MFGKSKRKEFKKQVAMKKEIVGFIGVD